MAGTDAPRTRHDLYLEISQDLTDDEAQNLRSYIGGSKVLPAGRIQHATVHEMFTKLERKGVLKAGDLSYLAWLMTRIGRDDYADEAKEIAKKEKEETGRRRLSKEDNDSQPSSSGAQAEKFPTPGAPQRRSTEDLEELIKNNFPLLKKRLQVSDLFPHLIQKRLLQLDEKEEIESKRTRQGRADALLVLLSQQGKCTCDAFREVLRLGNHGHIIDQLQ